MVRMTVLASGSRGNCTVVTGGRTTVLVDAGLSCREIVKRMAQAGEDPRRLDAILITHEHQDHVQGLSVLARRLGIPVYFTEATHRAWMRWMVPQKRMTYADWLAARKAEAAAKALAGVEEIPVLSASSGDGRSAAEQPLEAFGRGAESAPVEAETGADELCTEECFEAGATAGNASRTEEVQGAAARSKPSEKVTESDAPHPTALPAVEYFRAGKPFSIGDLDITALTIPHDAADPVAFVLGAEGVKVGLATDLGYMPANVKEGLRGCDVVMLESNHDLDMLRDGPYPWSVKQRVLSRVGHLSNAAAAEFLERGYDGQAAYVVLAHLSESNNLPELARMAAEWALRDRMKLLANRLVIAAQHEPTESICL